MKCILILWIAGVLSALSAEKPNIILIYTDDQGYGDASCLNPDAKFSTPNLDRLAREGIAFTNAHCSDTVCTPFRYGLLTGRYSWRTSLKTGVMGAEGKCLIADGRATLPSLLRESGYQTAMVGKWHLGMDFPGTSHKDRDWSQPVKDMPLDKGFDYFYGVPASLNYGVLAWFEGRFATVPPSQFTKKKPNDRHSDYRIMPPYEEAAPGLEVAPDFIDNQCLTRFTDKALEWMRREREKPFFLYLPFTSPHYPVCPLPEFHGKGNCGGYGEFVIETDYHVGRILEYLKSANIDENTLILFTSDNGPEHSWAARIKEFGHHSNGVYRGGKRDIYEGGHRVPFLVRWPAGIKEPGRTCDALIGQVDIMASLVDLIGGNKHDAEDSQSFVKVMSDPDYNHQRQPLINHGASGRFAITEGKWKLIMPHKKLKAELYDLVADPGEAANLAPANAERVTELTKKITNIINTHPNDTGYWKDLQWMTAKEFQKSE